MLIAIWGVLKAGGAYVPIDADYPEERIRYMLEDSGCGVVVTQSALRERISGDETTASGEMRTTNAAPLLICLDDLQDLLALLPADRVGVGGTASSLAYVIYTSGSTGRPKGVMIEQGSIVNLVYNQVGPLRLRPGIRVFQFASLSFDASCYEIFCTGLCGGQLELASKETVTDSKQLAILLADRQVELITLPPSYQAVLVEEDVSIKTVVSAGEALLAGLAGSLQQKGIRVINAYGPTENTVCSTLSEWPVSADGLVTIGKPLGNVQAYILDGDRQPVPVGVSGELYLGGAQVARGYLHRPELTEERFIPDPFGPAGARLYRTGDLARWLPDGNIVYQGRVDDQVKIRGYRIEPGEVEHVLQQAPGVRQCVVVASEDKHGDKRLIGYMTGEGLDRQAIRSYLRERLPDHLIPSILIPLEQLPLTPNGKIDRKQLRQPDDVLDVRPGYAAPRNPLEEQLAVIWQQLLGVDRVGIYDNFFELGGHSLLAIRMMSAIEKSLQVEISVNTLFLFPNIADLGRSVRIALGNTFTVPEEQEAIKI
jgi:amino acid adenylation domain-containing protein